MVFFLRCCQVLLNFFHHVKLFQTAGKWRYMDKMFLAERVVMGVKLGVKIRGVRLGVEDKKKHNKKTIHNKA